MKNIKICHLTSVHTRYDIRIFEKECKSLLKEDYVVLLIVADGQGDEIKDGINIYDVGKLKGRFNRFLKTTTKIFEKAKDLDAEVYHLHDPELIPIGLKLKKIDKKVIFDAHEDLPKQILSKPYLNKNIAIVLSFLLKKYEHYACRKFDYIMAATPYITNKFLKINSDCVNINNYPILGELDRNTLWSEKKDQVCYVGGISEIRGIKELVNAMGLIDGDVKLNLLGNFNDDDLKREVTGYKGWKRVNEYGFLKRNEVAEIMSRSLAGIVTFYPMPNHIDAQPNKMFEYMSSGLPIIISDFPYWRKIIDENSCGVLVNPTDSKGICNAIMFMVKNPEKASEMGRKGKEAVYEKYNWRVEEKKLITAYKNIL